jgi:hypothetical protein
MGEMLRKHFYSLIPPVLTRRFRNRKKPMRARWSSHPLRSGKHTRITAGTHGSAPRARGAAEDGQSGKPRQARPAGATGMRACGWAGSWSWAGGNVRSSSRSRSSPFTWPRGATCGQAERSSPLVMTPPASSAFAADDSISLDFVCAGRGAQPAILSLRHQIIRSRQPEVFYSAHNLVSHSNFYSTFRELTTASSKIKMQCQPMHG